MKLKNENIFIENSLSSPFLNVMDPLKIYQDNISNLLTINSVNDASILKTNLSLSSDEKYDLITKSYEENVSLLNGPLQEVNISIFDSPILNSLHNTNLTLTNNLNQDLNISMISTHESIISPLWEEKTDLLSIAAGSMDTIKASEITAKNHFTSLAEYSLASEEILYGIEWNHANIEFTPSVLSVNQVNGPLLQFTNEYSDLMTNLSTPSLNIGNYPPIVTEMPPVELFTTTNLAETLLTPIEKSYEISTRSRELTEFIHEDVYTTFEGLLDSENPKFLKIWDGVKMSLKSDNPERVRHVSTSLRELYTHLTHTMAPNSAIAKWTSDKKLYHNGNPTRKARLLYLSRDINSGSFTDFIEKDVESTLEFIDLFNKTTHELSSKVTDSQLSAMATKAASLFGYLIQIKNESS